MNKQILIVYCLLKMISLVTIFLVASVLMISTTCSDYIDTATTEENLINCGLPENCKLATKKQEDSLEQIIVCQNYQSLRFNKDKCKHELDDIKGIKDGEKPYLLTLHFTDYTKNYVLENSFQMHKIVDLVNPFLGSTIQFINLKGFDVDLALELNDSVAFFEFHDLDFNFYSRNKLIIRTCEEYESEKTKSQSNKSFIFNVSSEYFFVMFSNTRFNIPICPLIFEEIKLATLRIDNLVKSYYKRNVINYHKIDRSIDSEIENFELQDFYGLDLNVELINRDIFNNTTKFLFDGVINSIETDLFKYFKNLKSIKFNPVYLLEIVRKQGIDWIKSINHGLKVNLKDSKSVTSNMGKSVEIKFTVYNVFDFVYNPKAHIFYDEDFCLFVDYPFDQLVITNIHLKYDVQKLDLSCTTLWLIQYYPIYFEYSKSFELIQQLNLTLQSIKDRSVFHKCGFKSRLESCKRSNFKIKPRQEISGFDLMIISQFLLVIFTPIVSLFGVVTNLLVVLTVIDKKNRKQLKEKQYTYMALNSLSNLLILSIQILALVNECQYPFGIFCSSIRKYKLVQYFKIIFVEMISAFLRLISNFTYLAFSINRIFLIRKSKGFFESFSKLSTVVYIIVAAVISFLLSLIKAFRFKINLFMALESYPYIFYRNLLYYANETKTTYQLLFIFDAVYDLVNYVVFAFLMFLLDVVFFIRVRAALKEKGAKYKVLYALIDPHYMEKKTKEDNKILRKITLLIVSTTIVSFASKVPNSVTSLNDLRLLSTTPFNHLEITTGVGHELFKFPYTMKTICYLDEICSIFNNFGNFLFMLSLSLNFFFFLNFDKNFNSAFYLVFSFSKKNDSIDQKKTTLNSLEVKS